jgi:hypothetical protein
MKGRAFFGARHGAIVRLTREKANGAVAQRQGRSG